MTTPEAHVAHVHVVNPHVDHPHVVHLHVAVDHPAFDGHFPGRPLLPGVVLLALATEAALAEPAWAVRLGTAPRIASAKFLAPVEPGDTLTLTLTLAAAAAAAAATPATGRIAFELRRGERRVAAGVFEGGSAGDAAPAPAAQAASATP